MSDRAAEERSWLRVDMVLPGATNTNHGVALCIPVSYEVVNLLQVKITLGRGVTIRHRPCVESLIRDEIYPDPNGQYGGHAQFAAGRANYNATRDSDSD